MTDASPGSRVDVEALSSLVEDVFRRVAEERMAGVPILNPALRVATVGARAVEDAWLTVLVTPWCINLMLLPGNPEEASRWAGQPSGAKVKRQFPAGVFEFTVGAEDRLGPFQMCSLFSPVLEFENQEAALLTAEAALNAMFEDEQTKQTVEPSGVSRRGLLFGGGGKR